MPEVVEVQIQMEGLRNSIVGDKIIGVEFHHKGEKIIRPLSPSEFKNVVLGREITFVNRIGKFIVIKLDKEILMTSHLAMTGRWLLDVPEEKVGHTRIAFNLLSGRKLRYSDVRVFGRIRLEDNLGGKIYRNKGLDVFKADEDEIKRYLLSIVDLKGNENLKKILTDQKILCGLGNVYANEVLWAASIHPERKLGSLREEEIKLLAITIKEILDIGYELGGLSLRDYYHIDGSKGLAQEYLQIYQKEFCPNCGTKVLKSEEFDGRTTYYCPHCQFK